MTEPSILRGNIFEDHRGSIRFINDFDMNQVVRFYEISPVSTQQLRGWQGHQLEKKWFHCQAGGFIINVIKIDDFENPSTALQPVQFIISATNPEVLVVPEGYATAFKSIEENSKIQVFSNFDVETSKQDDYRFPITQWSTNWNINHE